MNTKTISAKFEKKKKHNRPTELKSKLDADRLEGRYSR